MNCLVLALQTSKRFKDWVLCEVTRLVVRGVAESEGIHDDEMWEIKQYHERETDTRQCME